jgi:hypothetical protein
VPKKEGRRKRRLLYPAYWVQRGGVGNVVGSKLVKIDGASWCVSWVACPCTVCAGFESRMSTVYRRECVCGDADGMSRIPVLACAWSVLGLARHGLDTGLQAHQGYQKQLDGWDQCEMGRSAPKQPRHGRVAQLWPSQQTQACPLPRRQAATCEQAARSEQAVVAGRLDVCCSSWYFAERNPTSSRFMG